MEQKTIPTEKNYYLSKVKLNPNGGLQADYQVTETVGGEPSVTDCHASVSRDIHPDLRGLFEDLRPILGRIFGFTSFLAFSEADELIDKIDVRGVSLSGADDNTGVIIAAVFEASNGLKVHIKTSRIRLDTNVFGFEGDLGRIVGAIKMEVYQFLFCGKQAQLSLFGEQAPAGESGTAANNEPDFGPGDDMSEM